LLAFAGGLAGLWSLSNRVTTAEGVKAWVRSLTIGTWGMAAISWITVMTGTYIVYPWYREATPDSARSILLSSPDTELWHRFAFEWKEHVAFLAPILPAVASWSPTKPGSRQAPGAQCGDDAVHPSVRRRRHCGRLRRAGDQERAGLGGGIYHD
jgi:hypothetical protein